MYKTYQIYKGRTLVSWEKDRIIPWNILSYPQIKKRKWTVRPFYNDL